MTAKPVIDIDLKDDKFQAFLKLWDKFQSELKNSGRGWDTQGKSIDGTALHLNRITQELEIQTELLKGQLKAFEGFNREVDRGGRGMDRLARDTRDVSRNILSATVSLLKWGTITGALGGLLGAGGLWGIDRLALSAGGARRSAGGLGVTSGQQQAFNINYGRFFDANSNLQRVADAQSDLSRRGAFQAVGFSPGEVDSMNPAQLASEMAIRAKKIYDSSDKSEQQMRSRGLLEFYSMNDLRMLHTAPMGELERAKSGYAGDSRDLAIDPSKQSTWQNFSAQLDRAGTKIENIFIDKLGNLEPGLEKLSKAVVDVLAAFTSSPLLDEWLKDVNSGLESFAKTVGTQKFKDGVEDFAKAIWDITLALGRAVRWIARLFPSAEAEKDAATPGTPLYDQEHRPGQPGWGFTPGLGWHKTPLIPGSAPQGPETPDDIRRQAAQHFASLGLGQAGTLGMLGALWTESKFDPDSFNADGGGEGARGLANWRGKRLVEFRSRYGHDMLDQSVPRAQRAQEQIEFAGYELTGGKYKSVGDQLKRASSPKDAATIAVNDYESPGPYEIRKARNHAIDRAGLYARDPVIVTIFNNTAANVNVTGSQVKQQ